MANSKSRKRKRKVGIPYDDFPLGMHAGGYWCKRINGTLHYFGKWAERKNGELVPLPDYGWQAALELFQAQRDDLYAGRKPRAKAAGDEMTVGEVGNQFITHKTRQRDQGRLSPRMFNEYEAAMDRVVAEFGKDRPVDDLRPDDFANLLERICKGKTKQWGVHRVANAVQGVRTIFKFAYDAGLIDKPMRFGPGFAKPTAAEVRKDKAKRGPKMFEADELRRIIDAARQPLRAMILLALNCGYGNHDCAMLPLSALDLERGWVRFPRPKTGIERRCPLWPETLESLKKAIATRAEPKCDDHQGLVFVTKYGGAWFKDIPTSPVGQQFLKLLSAIDKAEADAAKKEEWEPAPKLRRAGHGFYTLRRVFRTIADESRDQPAVDYIMGHAASANDMAAVYRQRIRDQRLQAVVDHVRAWLFPAEESKKKTKQQKPKREKKSTSGSKPSLRVVG